MGTSTSIPRRLAAIVSADVVRYSALIERDEAGTINAIRELQSNVISPATATRGGRLFKTMGDGVLYEFPSIVAAVEACIAVQTAMAGNETSPIRFRIGVHLGDVVPDGDDLLGDGVNVAARIEAKAEPGGVALSDDAHRQIRDKLEAGWRDGGLQSLKNISRPMRVWHWSPGQGAQPAPADRPAEEVAKPAIAVLAFDNMSGDSEQEYFADGLVEDVTTALSRYSELFVTSRASAFFYKGKQVDIRTIARELGVRYVLEGSVRRAGQRLRVTAQLIEAGSDTHLWADRYDRTVDDLFDIQDEITINVAGAVGNEIERAETTRVSRKRIGDLDAWERLMKGLWCLERGTAEGNVRSQDIFRREIADADGGASAHAWLVAGIAFDMMWGFSGRKPGELVTEGLAAGRAAVALDSNSDIARAWLSVFLLIAGEHDVASDEAKTAIRLNPNLALGHQALGYVLAHSGPEHLAEACKSLTQAIKLGPRDNWTPMCHANMGMANLVAGRFESSIGCARTALRYNPEFGTAFRILASALALSGRIEEASQSWNRSLEVGQVDLVAFKASIFRILKRREDAERYSRGLMLAGMNA